MNSEAVNQYGQTPLRGEGESVCRYDPTCPYWDGIYCISDGGSMYDMYNPDCVDELTPDAGDEAIEQE